MRLSREEFARRAGTTKPAIYRRWTVLQRLVLAALTQRLGELQVPDTGTLCASRRARATIMTRTEQKLDVARAVEASGLERTHLRPAELMTSALGWAGSIRPTASSSAPFGRQVPSQPSRHFRSDGS